jgi:hypothetical protein
MLIMAITTSNRFRDHKRRVFESKNHYFWLQHSLRASHNEHCWHLAFFVFLIDLILNTFTVSVVYRWLTQTKKTDINEKI